MQDTCCNYIRVFIRVFRDNGIEEERLAESSGLAQTACARTASDRARVLVLPLATDCLATAVPRPRQRASLFLLRLVSRAREAGGCAVWGGWLLTSRPCAGRMPWALRGPSPCPSWPSWCQASRPLFILYVY